MFKYILIIITFCHIFVFAGKDMCYDTSKMILKNLKKCQYDLEDNEALRYTCNNGHIDIFKSGKIVLLYDAPDGTEFFLLISLDTENCGIAVKDELGVNVIPFGGFATTLTNNHKIYNVVKNKITKAPKPKPNTECPASWQDSYGKCKPEWYN